jgi:hypothetical protein
VCGWRNEGNTSDCPTNYISFEVYFSNNFKNVFSENTVALAMNMWMEAQLSACSAF